MKIFCFPFAGGTRSSLLFLKQYMADAGLEFVPIEYPGHGSRFREPLMRNTHHIVDDIHSQIIEQLDGPYAFYGHSFGALVSYLLTHKLLENNQSLPQHLFVSGSQAPSTIINDKPYHVLPDNEFLECVKQLGGLPEEILQSPRAVQLYLSILKADFEAYETYTYVDRGALDIPVTSVFGEDDIHYDKYIKDWQVASTLPAAFYYLPGNHFFIYEQGKQLVDIFSGRLDSLNAIISH